MRKDWTRIYEGKQNVTMLFDSIQQKEIQKLDEIILALTILAVFLQVVSSLYSKI